MEKNHVVLMQCHQGDLDCDQEWNIYYGPYTEETATSMVAQLSASYSPTNDATVRGFVVFKLRPITVAEILVEAKKENGEES